MKRNPLVIIFALFLIFLGMGTWIPVPNCQSACATQEAWSVAFLVLTGLTIPVFFIVLVERMRKKHGKS